MSEQRVPLATRDEVAAYLGVPTSTLAHWRTSGTGPVSITVGRHVRYRWSDVETWLEGQVDCAGEVSGPGSGEHPDR